MVNGHGPLGAPTSASLPRCARVVDGTYEPGSRMPGEHALCAEFATTRNTLRRALEIL
ncbi:GntR family transcriptional regulator [Actinomadura logoneensis]|uniref:GntR family transcriptional regulator n=1 Tax=Actinomadura logoneensis TaxID=2293572 RepID=A0A372J9Q6_9ACTN|nr:GntR family transcriptional regulator [Actinomadura logoneensis]